MPSAYPFPDPGGEPLGLLLQPSPAPEAFQDCRCRRFEFSSRGDRVPGRLLLPPEPRGPAPLILLQHGTGGSKESPYLDVAVRWVHAGAAVASIDFPLHGERTSAKLSEQFFSSLAPGSWDDKNGMTEIGKTLWLDFTRQAVTDLRRSVDALATLDGIDETRVAFGGFSLGAIVGALFCSVEERIRGAALALAGGGFGPPEIDPCNAIAAIAPRPVLFLNALQDQRVPPAASQALYEAALEPKRIEWFEAGHQNLPGAAMKSMWNFFREVLELQRPE